MRSNCSVFEDLGGRDLPSSRPVPRPPGFASISSIFPPSDHLGPPAVLRGRNTRRCGRVRKSRRDESSRRPLYDRSAGSARQRQWRTATCIASTVPQSWQRKGLGTARNLPLARTMYRRAAEPGFTPAMVRVSEDYAWKSGGKARPGRSLRVAAGRAAMQSSGRAADRGGRQHGGPRGASRTAAP